MENTLNIQITLNDEQLKDLIVGNINDLPKEQLQDILLQAIKEILLTPDGQKMFFEQNNYYDKTVKPSRFLERLVDKADIKDTISPIVNQAVAEFAANYPNILEKCLKSAITSMFMDQFQQSQLQIMWDKMMEEK